MRILLSEIARRVIRSTMTVASPINWQGVYHRYEDVPVERGHYDFPQRIAEFTASTRRVMESVRAGQIPDSPWHKELALLASLVFADRGAVRVLDFGGAMGLGYLQLVASLPPGAVIDYHIVDLPGICNAGETLHANDKGIHFHTELADAAVSFDIVYASSVLPYVKEYKDLLHKLTSLNADYILLTQLAAGNFPTYAAQQVNLSGQSLPYWFLNLQEIIQCVSKKRYALVHLTEAGPRYNQKNFPPEYRLGRMKTLLFVKRTNN